MDTRTIPSDQWIEYFDEFSREHVGWDTSIEILDKEIGDQYIAKHLPLMGISFDTKGSRPCAIEIGAGDRPNRHITHIVDMPLHIREVQEGDGSVDVQIEPANGPVTLIHLRGPVH